MTADQALARAEVQDPQATQFVVRLYDGMDGEWMDVSEPVDGDEAKRIWSKETDNGSRATSYSDIDYYAIYPSTVKMVFSEEGLGPQHR